MDNAFGGLPVPAGRADKAIPGALFALPMVLAESNFVQPSGDMTMHKTSRPISDYMTPMPFTIECDESLVKARALMREFHIRHLPVRSDYRIVGMLSLAEVEFIASRFPDNFSQKTVQEALVKNPYIVSPDTPLEQVSSHMAKQKVDFVLIVQESGSLVGIFTEIDALRALTKVCQGF